MFLTWTKQTAIFYDMPPNYSVIQRGTRQNRILITNNEKKRISVLLAVRGDGRKLKPLIVFKGVSNARVSQEVRNYDDDISLHTAQAKAWTDEDVLKYWYKNVWREATAETRGPKVLLVDSYGLHKDNEDLFHGRRQDIQVKFIPKHCTGLIQPLYIGIIRSFKQRVRQMWLSHYFENEEVTREVLSQWVKQAWQDVPTTAITNAFSRLSPPEAMEIE